MTLLLVEDDYPLADGLARVLRQQGYEVDVAATGSAACLALDGRRYELVVLDLGLPDLDGSEVVRRLAQLRLDTPVLVLSARDALDERVRLLNLGADDYLVKPAAVDEFLARVRAVLRRKRSHGEQRISLGRLTLDLEGRRAYVDAQPIELNSRDWSLLVFLASRANRVVSKEDIVVMLHGNGDGVSPNAIEQVMSRFRKRFGEGVLHLRTVRGLGYYLEVDDGAAGA